MSWLTFQIDVDATAKSLAYDVSTQPLGVKGNPRAKKVLLQAHPSNTNNVSIAGSPLGSAVTDGEGITLVPGAQLTWDAGQLDARIGSDESWLFSADWSDIYAISGAADQSLSVTFI